VSTRDSRRELSVEVLAAGLEVGPIDVTPSP
jgi:hypothetical protein